MHALKLWAKKWLLWHMACPIHGREFTEKRDDPDASWDAGQLTYCTECHEFCYLIQWARDEDEGWPPLSWYGYP